MKKIMTIAIGTMLLFLSVVTAACGTQAQKAPPQASKIEAVAQQQVPDKQIMAVPHGVPVLMYHKIGDEAHNDAVISKERFAEQMAFLYNQQYNPVTLDQLHDYIVEKKPLPLRPVVITFDDGYRDTYEIAMPILKQYGFRSTLFLPAGEVGKNISWDELRQMKAAGMDIGSHSLTHTELAGLSRDVQAREIGLAKEIFDRELQQNTRWFCYPYGVFDNTTKNLLKANGITVAVTIQPGWAKAGDDVLTLRRVWMGNQVTLKHFAERITREDYPIL